MPLIGRGAREIASTNQKHYPVLFSQAIYSALDGYSLLYHTPDVSLYDDIMAP